MAPTTQTDDTDALLNRLTRKPGVQSALILSRKDGCIVRTTGLLSSNHNSNAKSALSPSNQRIPAQSGDSVDTATGSLALRDEANQINRGRPGAITDAEEVARMVWSFVGAAGTMVEGMDAEDEVKLLRLRTTKNELVIVPDSKFLLVVIHDTPPA